MPNRLQRRLRVHYLRWRYGSSTAIADPGQASLSAAFRHPIDARRRALLVSKYRELFPAAVGTELAAAGKLASHEFTFLGHTARHGTQIAWSRDPVSGRDWSRGFSPDIVYRGPGRLGDIKLPWESSKHQYFFTLGKAGWLADDPEFPREIIRQIDHWIDDNPYLRGIHWISGLESGARAVSWIMAYPFFAEHCSEAFRGKMVRSIAQHMLFVEDNLPVGRFANNHLIADAATLAIGGLFLEHRHSARWLAVGLQHLEMEMERQVRPDGVHAEQSVGYHRFILDQYYLVHAILSANQRSFAPATYAVLERMTGFLMDALFPDGTAPAFGDCDDARAIAFHADSARDYRALLALGATHFGRGDFKSIAGAPAEELLWLHGSEGVDAFLSLPSRQPRHTSTAYPHAGYYLMRSGWQATDSLLAFDCGPLGYGSAGHGHADALSLQLYAASFPFLTDSGTYSYNLDYACRDAFRSTRAHNTIAVEGEEQSTPQDRMSWATHARARCHRWITTLQYDLVDGEHDGYQRLSNPVTHRRIVVFVKPDVWIICDRLSGAGSREIEMLWHVRPDCGLSRSADGIVVLTSPAGAELSLWLLQQLPAPLSGDERPRCEEVDDWYSERYGEKRPTRTVRIAGVLRENAMWVTCLSMSKTGRVRSGASTDGLRIAIDRRAAEMSIDAGGGVRVAVNLSTEPFVTVLHPLEINH